MGPDKRTTHAFCLAWYGNRQRCTRLDEPFETWCEAVATDSTSQASSPARAIADSALTLTHDLDI